MNILVTGAKGFVGKNLVENLKTIRDGKNRTRPAIQIGEIVNKFQLLFLQNRSLARQSEFSVANRRHFATKT